jgi:hypothetical protein
MTQRHLFGKVAASISLCALTACGAGYPPPDGYIDACYGGDFRAKIMGAGTLQFTMRIAATESQWPELASKLGVVGRAHGLQVFDTSMTPAGLRIFEVSLCTPRGLWVYADKRIWAQGPPDHDPDHVSVILYQYDAAYDWEPVAAALLNEFKDWPGNIKSEYPARKAAGA